MTRSVRLLVSGFALALVYACVPTPPGEGGGSSGGSTSSSGGTSGTSGSSSSGSSGDDAAASTDGSTDGATSNDGSVVAEGGSDAAADAAPDVTVDAASDGGTCPIKCVTNVLLPSGQPAPPSGGDAALCTGGCSWYGGAAQSEYRNVCHVTCGGACVPDPPYGGVCPPECNGGCADGKCNIVCGSAGLPDCVPPRPADTTNAYFFGVLKCPDGMPCKVSCLSEAGGSVKCPGVVACPRDGVSCEIDCGLGASKGCGETNGPHFYCGTGPCKIMGDTPGIGASGRGAAPEYNMALDACGHACSCDIPYPPIYDNGAGTRCLCKDGTIFNGIAPPGEDRCPAKCATHGGWSVPWERTPYSL